MSIDNGLWKCDGWRRDAHYVGIGMWSFTDHLCCDCASSKAYELWENRVNEAEKALDEQLDYAEYWAD
jgi:hypothetical protein